METDYIVKVLANYNEWRRYNGDIDKSPEMPNPTELGKVIDAAVGILNKKISDNEIKQLGEMVKVMELDHEPSGYPAIQMKYVSALWNAVEYNA